MGSVWPSPEDYQSAVQNPRRYLSDTRLHSAQVETRKLGAIVAPYPRSGNFGAVYKFTNQRQAYALKVFIKAQPDREQRYHLIDQHLERQHASPGLVSFGYEPQGILIKGRRYPTLVMDWVEGQTLDNYLSGVFRRDGQLPNGSLCRAWTELVLKMNEQRLAHGDLQHGNILILPDGSLKLVDYDGMFVPAMKQARLRAAEIGLPAYQHPQRNRGYFDERLDDFAALVILLCLASLNQERWQRYHTDDNCLIVKENDLVHPEQSEVLTELSQSPDAPVRKLAILLKAAAAGGLDSIPSFSLVAADSTVRQLLNNGWRPTASVRPSPKTPLRRCARCSAELRPADQFCRQCATPVRGNQQQQPSSSPLEKLTPLQREILSHLVAGHFTDGDIGQKVRLPEVTVRNQISEILSKAGVISRMDLMKWASRQGVKPSHRPSQPPVTPPVTTPPPRPFVPQPPPPSPAGTLTPRQVEILNLLIMGQTDEMIAHKLQIQPQDVKDQFTEMTAKLGVSTRANLLRWARDQGFRPLPLTTGNVVATVIFLLLGAVLTIAGFSGNETQWFLAIAGIFLLILPLSGHIQRAWWFMGPGNKK